jgi:membrane protein YdbS with pleckstrin-like domain
MSPIVDRITGRHVRWFSWAGLTLALVSLFVAFAEPAKPGVTRYAFNILLIVDVIIYLAAYFVRLQFMSKLGKSDNPAVTKGYLVEEQMVGAPSVLLMMGLLALFLGGKDPQSVGAMLRWGFTEIWSTSCWGWVVLLGIFSQGTGIFGTLVLLDRSETAFAVPVNRSSSVIAGIGASLLLYFVLDLKLPSVYQFAGAAVIILAILFLSIPPLLEKYKKRPTT